MMQVDLAKALDAQTTEPQRGDRAASEGKFPGVLKSTLSGAPRAEGSAGRGPGKPNEKSVTAENSKPPSEGSASDERAAEAAAESGAVGATAGPVDPSRQSTQAEASEEAEGRLTDLANQARSSAEEEGGAAVAEDEFVDAEIASEIDAQLESAATEPAADGDEVAAAAPNAGVAEGSREMNEELATNARDAAQEDSERRDGEDRDRAREDREASRAAEERRELESAGFERSEIERAADEYGAAGSDATLSQQVATSEATERAPEVAAVDGAAAIANPIAGAQAETTSAPTPGSPTPAAASDAIAVQTEWLATRGGGTARLILHPPELGELAIRVTLRGSAVDVVVMAQEAAAGGVAEEQSERLAQAFANRDLRLENFEVRRGEPDELGVGAEGQFAQSESEAEREDAAAEDDATKGRAGRLGRQGQRDGQDEQLVAVPRILNITPEERGVDLRI